MHGGGGGWGTIRSFTRDRSAARRRLAPGTTRRIVSFARPYAGFVGTLTVLLAVDAAAGAVTPLIFREIINEGVLGKDSGLVVRMALVVAGIAILTGALGLVERYCGARIGEGLIFDMRSRVFAHIQRMPLAFFTRTQTGALVSRLNNDVLGAQQAFTSTLSNVVSNLLTAVFTLSAMFVLSWQITLVSLVMLPLFLLPARWLGRKLQAITRESYDLNAQMNAMLTERLGVSGALLVKLFGRHEVEDEAFGQRAARVRDIGVTQAMYSRVFFTALMLVASLSVALVYGWGGVQAVAGALSVGTLVALTAYLTRLYGPLTALSNVHVDIMTALVSFERVFEVLDLEPLVKNLPGARDLPAEVPASIEFDRVSFEYPRAAEVSLASLETVAVLDQTVSTQVLHEVSVRAEAGQLVALVGQSGAGKTTMTHLVTRMYDVTAGAVRVGGIDVRDLTLESLRDAIGVVTQDPHMFHDTIRANLLYAKPDATEDELVEALRAAQIWTLVASLADGLDTVVGERGYRLSGGEKQRLAIARLLLKAPRIVVLDEATAHLDSESEAAVQKALATALAGRTSLVIAHRLSTVRDADLIVVLDEGRIAERGTHEQLLAAGGLYAELYRTQFRPQAEAQGTL
ncbi:ABC transporter ATP-binding protein [Actinopolymorpha singaporensis]|uniref:ATP-binding cassette, subfamily B n=1 Tax=Actinopolymorpha singaporensis TaxID=117157 RepID=A0A1H1XJU9_9ACTN|nr:ABC transporter ATP-binding protein [Actinopolymorpha singaporensis]SDT09452.1 ATP-binding cassette, subfamily B [Actinopolymorpha singaporensis]